MLYKGIRPLLLLLLVGLLLNSGGAHGAATTTADQQFLEEINAIHIASCDECRKSRQESSSTIILACGVSPCVYVDSGRLLVNDAVATDYQLNQFLDAKGITMNFSKRPDLEQDLNKFDLVIENTTMIDTLDFGRLEYLDGELIIMNTTIGTIKCNSLQVNGNVTIRGNRKLKHAGNLTITDEKKYQMDLQSPKECFGPLPWDTIYQECVDYIGDVTLVNYPHFLWRGILEYIVGCLNVDIMNNASVGFGFFQSGFELSGKNCSTIHACVSDKSFIEYKKMDRRYADIALVRKSGCTQFQCVNSDIEEYSQDNCVELLNFMVIWNNSRNPEKYASVRRVYGGVDISHYPNATLDLSHLEQIVMRGNRIDEPAIKIVNNPLVTHLKLSRRLQIVSTEVDEQCNRSIIAIDNNPKLHLDESKRSFLTKLATTADKCEADRILLQPYWKEGFPEAPNGTTTAKLGDVMPAGSLEPNEAPEEEFMEEEELTEGFVFSAGFWLLIAVVSLLLPAVIGAVLLGLKCRSHLGKKSQLRREIEALQERTRDLPYPCDLSQTRQGLTVDQSHRLLQLMRQLLQTPVLRLREMAGQGIPMTGPGEEAVVDPRLMAAVLGGVVEKATSWRQELAKRMAKSTVLPVYELVSKEELEQLHRDRRSNRSEAIRRPADLSCHQVYEISDRPFYPRYRNENKLREVFDIWSHLPREYYVLFTVGPVDFAEYCGGRVFAVKEEERPEGRGDRLLDGMAGAGIGTRYYHVEYCSRKVKGDRRRCFRVEVHNVKIDREHPFSGRVDELRSKQVMQLMCLARELDAAVLCLHPEVFVLLKLCHISFFFVYSSPAEAPAGEDVVQAALAMALDEADWTRMAPPDAVHLFALQMIDFCGPMVEEKMKGGFGASGIASYHEGTKTAPADPDGSRARASMKAYEKSTLAVNAVVGRMALGRSSPEQIDWTLKLPTEAQYCLLSSPEKWKYMREVYFHDYSSDLLLLPLAERRRKATERYNESLARRKRLNRMAKQQLGMSPSDSDSAEEGSTARTPQVRSSQEKLLPKKS